MDWSHWTRSSESGRSTGCSSASTTVHKTQRAPSRENSFRIRRATGRTSELLHLHRNGTALVHGSLSPPPSRRDDGEAVEQRHCVPSVLVYLDVDGVLNTTLQRASQRHLDHDLIANLRSVIEAIPGAAIILSTSWRLQPTLKEALTKSLATAGVPAPFGETCEMPLPAPRGYSRRGELGELEWQLSRFASQRAAEILASVAIMRPCAWIAIDDLDLTSQPLVSIVPRRLRSSEIRKSQQLPETNHLGIIDSRYHKD